MRVWVPFADWVERVSSAADGVEVDVYDGAGEPPGSIGAVELYVLPYMVGPGPARLMSAMPSLRVAQTLTAGVDDVRPLVPAGVTLCNARGVHDASTAELAVALMLASLRGIPDFVRNAEHGRWDGNRRDSLADRTVLIVGYGSVGEAVERRLAGFECDVRRVARSARDGVEPFAALPELLPRADVVVLTVPMTDETRGMVDARFLARMRDGALLVNVARGPVVRTDDLLAEVTTGRLRAALDVTDPEPLPPDHPLWSSPGVLVSPHVGGNTTAFRPRALRLVVDQVRRYAAGVPLANVISADY
ncbi:MAG TPA: 2-hydroxyacid dehydrogenase [Actinomycetes bacterium]